MSTRRDGEASRAIRRGDRPRFLHVINLDKFIAPFIDFLEGHFSDFDQHVFFSFGDDVRFPVRRRSNTVFESDFGSSYSAYLELNRKMNRAEKVIIHGLWDQRLVRALFFQPWLLKNCYWVIWGGDLYAYKFGQRGWLWHKDEFFRRFVIKRFGHLVTYVEGDVDLARQWYGARGQYHECLMYPSNLFKGHKVPSKIDSTIRILIGNSADPSNEHLEMLEMLERYKDEDIKIYAPLSYGDTQHALKVTEAGKAVFGSKFIALIDFMPLDQYQEFLGKIDIAVFNHRRQQAMGTIITLLGQGKKVHMRNDVVQKIFLDGLGVTTYDVNGFELDLIDEDTVVANRSIIEKRFSMQELVSDYQQIFSNKT